MHYFSFMMCMTDIYIIKVPRPLDVAGSQNTYSHYIKIGGRLTYHQVCYSGEIRKNLKEKDLLRTILIQFFPFL